jgi:hypothetical protein
MNKLLLSLIMLLLAASMMLAQDNGERSYCIGFGLCDGSNEYISRVQVGNIDHNTSAFDCQGYEYFPDQSIFMSPGFNYPVTVTNGMPNDPGYKCGIWIDWNQNSVFESTESITMTGSPGVGPYTANITPPPDALLGQTRMRVRLGFFFPFIPCGIDMWGGEVEDYPVFVFIPPDISLNPLSLSTNIPGHNGTSNQMLEIFNTGLGDLTWDASIDCGETIENFCLDFNGSNQYVHVDQPFPSFSQYTVEFWRYSKGASTTGWPRMITMVQNPDHSGNYIVIEHNNYDQNTLEITVTGDPNGYKAYVDVSAYQNKWVHIALTFDGSMTTTYINDEISNQSGGAPGSFQINSTFIGGCLMPVVGLSRYFNGRMDEVRIWNVARTQQQIQDCMDSTFCEPRAGMMAYWKLDDNPGSQITDETGNMANGVIENGAPWYTPGAPFNNDCIPPVPEPLIEITPVSGTIPPGGSAQVNLTFHSGDLPFGVYNDCSLVINSNDPDEGEHTLPLSVTIAEPVVVPVADWAVVLGVVLMVGMVVWWWRRS